MNKKVLREREKMLKQVKKWTESQQPVKQYEMDRENRKRNDIRRNSGRQFSNVMKKNNLTDPRNQ